MKTSIIPFLVGFIILGFFFSPAQKKELPKSKEFEIAYSFFVAGHTYGNPKKYTPGLHKPFVNQIDFINKYPNLKQGILTGDVVKASKKKFWNPALVDIQKFAMPIHIAAGNHDRGVIFDNLFKSYYSFTQNNDLFIILSPTNWNIKGQQKNFLKTTIQKNPQATNIFIFLHELVWWSPTNKFKNVKINFTPNYPGSSNYWNDIHPFLDSLTQPVTLFAGDLGATDEVSPFMYHRESDNITFIASGMGNIREDHILIVNVGLLGELRFNLGNYIQFYTKP